MIFYLNFKQQLRHITTAMLAKVPAAFIFHDYSAED
jgi:hypothetical protein